MEKDKYGCKHDDGHYSKMTGNDKNVCYSIYDKRPDKDGHSSIHINYNTVLFINYSKHLKVLIKISWCECCGNSQLSLKDDWYKNKSLNTF